MTRKCIVCGKEIKKRYGKDTCSLECGLKKAAAWSRYLLIHKDEIMKKALEEYG